jgi:hypothetical protein
MKHYSANITDGLIWLKMLLVKHMLLRSLNSDATTPDICQTAVLKRILEQNKNTALGKHYDFTSITNVEDYLKSVPVHGYEELRPYIEKQIETGEYAIVPEKPLMYAQTSGTTGKAKYIPVLKGTINSYKRAQRIFSYEQHRAIPKIFSGKILAIVSPAIEGHLNDGTPYGSMSGLVYQNMPDIILSKYVMPPSIFEIVDYETKYRLITAFALREADITCFATANPSTLIRISEIINQNSDAMIEFVEKGSFNALGVQLDSAQKKQLLDYATPNPQRAKVLKSLKQSKGELRFADIWPDLQGVVAWTSGNCALLLPKLRKQLLPETKIIEMGYLSSEFRGTITIDCERSLGIPTLQDNFFEFAEVDSWDSGNQSTLLLSQLEVGRKYYIIVTTPHGLYRYFINDIIEVTGRYRNTPTITFVQKGKGVTNLTGEKLYENQVIAAVSEAAKAYGITPEFFMMLADQQDFSYRLYIESTDRFDVPDFAQKLNDILGELNIEYQSKAQSGRIKFADVKRLKVGTLEAYKSSCIQAGQREGQFKVVKLQYRADVPFPFEEHIEL